MKRLLMVLVCLCIFCTGYYIGNDCKQGTLITDAQTHTFLTFPKGLKKNEKHWLRFDFDIQPGQEMALISIPRQMGNRYSLFTSVEKR